MPLSKRAMLRLSLLAWAPTALGACTMVGGGVRPAPGPEPREPLVAAESERRREARAEDATARVTARVVDIALESIGTPYEWGGTDANGFDCSGLIQFAYAKVGVALPRTSAAQMRHGSPIAPEPSRLRAGDVLGFSGGGSGKLSHVGLYVGGQEFIHSSSSGVRISSLRNPYWRRSLLSARRMVP